MCFIIKNVLIILVCYINLVFIYFLFINILFCCCFVEDRKLFIGMILKKVIEEDFRIMFLLYGIIEELIILRDSDGKSKGL